MRVSRKDSREYLRLHQLEPYFEDAARQALPVLAAKHRHHAVQAARADAAAHRGQPRRRREELEREEAVAVGREVRLVADPEERRDLAYHLRHIIMQTGILN